jgi:hypothetical protein
MKKWIEADNGAVRMELEPTSSEFSIYPYEIGVQTADAMGAGTDAKVSLYVEGDDGKHTFELNRAHSVTRSKELFERANFDKFIVYAKDIGDVS